MNVVGSFTAIGGPVERPKMLRVTLMHHFAFGGSRLNDKSGLRAPVRGCPQKSPKYTTTLAPEDQGLVPGLVSNRACCDQVVTELTMAELCLSNKSLISKSDLMGQTRYRYLIFGVAFE